MVYEMQQVIFVCNCRTGRVKFFIIFLYTPRLFLVRSIFPACWCIKQSIALVIVFAWQIFFCDFNERHLRVEDLSKRLTKIFDVTGKQDRVIFKGLHRCRITFEAIVCCCPTTCNNKFNKFVLNDWRICNNKETPAILKLYLSEGQRKT